MKNKLFLIPLVTLLFAMSSAVKITDTFTDSRDGKTYKTVTIGTQTWMAENLAYKASSGCWAYNDDATNVAKYGYLYNWEAAKTVCPAGWHLPSDAEWTTLIDNLGGANEVAKFKSVSGWKQNGNGTNSSGFNALPGGYRWPDGDYQDIGFQGAWWSSTGDVDLAYVRSVSSVYGKEFEIKRDSYQSICAISVRCIKD